VPTRRSSDLYPAINVLKSVSRVMNNIVTEDHRKDVQKLRDLMSAYEENIELIQIGAYRTGSDPRIDEAISFYDNIQAYLRQDIYEDITFEQTIKNMKLLLAGGGA